MNNKQQQTIIIGWPTIARLAHGETVNFDCGVTIIPDDLLFNTAIKIHHGEFSNCKCIDPREVIYIINKCSTCGEILKDNQVCKPAE